MIVDIYNEVYTNVKTTLSDLLVLNSYQSDTPTFPCVVIEEITNTADENTIDTNGEKYNDITFEVNIFTNSEQKISESKDIRKRVDAIFSDEYRMHRGFSGQTPNFADTNVYKYTLRYSFKIGQDKIIYRR